MSGVYVGGCVSNDANGARIAVRLGFRYGERRPEDIRPVLVIVAEGSEMDSVCKSGCL
jgi:hypothetical protein